MWPFLPKILKMLVEPPEGSLIQELNENCFKPDIYFRVMQSNTVEGTRVDVYLINCIKILGRALVFTESALWLRNT